MENIEANRGGIRKLAFIPGLSLEDGIRFWNIIIAVLLGIYAYYSIREGEGENGIICLGAAIFSLLISWGSSFYKSVWVAGALIVLAIVMYITPLSEGILPKLMFYTGGAILGAAILTYIFPAQASGGTEGFLLATVILGLIIVIDTTMGRYDEWWQVLLVFSIPVVAAVLLITSFGVDHAWYGLVMMYFGVILGLFGLFSYIVDPIFFGGLLVFTDDFVGEIMAGKDAGLLNLWFFLALVAGIIYIIYKYKEDWL